MALLSTQHCRSGNREDVNTVHCLLKNGADLYKIEHQKTQPYHNRATEERKYQTFFFTLPSAYINGTIIVMLYTHLWDISHRTQW